MWDPGLSRARCIRQTETNLTHALISSLHCAPYSSIVTKKIAVKIPGDGLLTLIRLSGSSWHIQWRLFVVVVVFEILFSVFFILTTTTSA